MQAPANPRKKSPNRKKDTYQTVKDSRGRRVRGLWSRNGRFFASMTVEENGIKKKRMVPLKGAASFSEAKEAYQRLLTERADGALPVMGRKPKFSEYLAESYESRLQASGNRESSQKKERGYLKHWNQKIGHLRLNEIRPKHIQDVLNELSTEYGYQGRSVNLYLIALRKVLKAARSDGHLKAPLPHDGIEWRKTDSRSRDLIEAHMIDQLCEAALEHLKNGRQFVDYIRFLQYSGARRNEALQVRWSDVDLHRGFVIIGAQGDAKNRRPRHVDLNAKLRELLVDMETRRQPDSVWLFPSPQRGDQDTPAKTFRESLKIARDKSGAHFGFHDLRHAFASQCVMSGIDFMTVAKWLGHQDGGMLVAKVYGHLADEHRKRQAEKLRF